MSLIEERFSGENVYIVVPVVDSRWGRARCRVARQGRPAAAYGAENGFGQFCFGGVAAVAYTVAIHDSEADHHARPGPKALAAIDRARVTARAQAWRIAAEHAPTAGRLPDRQPWRLPPQTVLPGHHQITRGGPVAPPVSSCAISSAAVSKPRFARVDTDLNSPPRCRRSHVSLRPVSPSRNPIFQRP